MRTRMTILLAGVLAMAEAHAQEVYVDNVVIVLDASGSMNELMSGTSIRKIDAAKNAIKEVVHNTPMSTQVGLLVFGNERRWEYPLGPRNDEQLIRALDRLGANGGTPLGEFIKKGADRLLEARKDQFGYGSYRLLIVTDGEASDAALMQRYMPDVISRGIVVDVIGVDMRQDHTLATKVHSYRRANDPEALSQAIREVFAEVGSASDSMSGADAFDELQGLPSEAAMAMITSMVQTGNEPIVEFMSNPSPPMPQPRKPTGQSSPPPRPGSSSTGGFGGFAVLVVIVVIGIQIISKMMRKG